MSPSTSPSGTASPSPITRRRSRSAGRTWAITPANLPQGRASDADEHATGARAPDRGGNADRSRARGRPPRLARRRGPQARRPRRPDAVHSQIGQAPVEQPRLAPGRNPGLERPEGELGDEEEPGGIDRRQLVDRASLRREQDRVVAGKSCEPEPNRLGRPAREPAEEEDERQRTERRARLRQRRRDVLGSAG